MLRVRLLGEFRIELDRSPSELPASRRARALLAWLALDRGMHSRSRLAARFWPDVLDESARTSLRSALSALRRTLGPDSERYLIATRDEVGLAGESLVWTDVAEFERCVDAGRLEEALAIGRGELLSGLDDEWVYERREEHRDRVAGVLARAAASAERQGDLQAAIELTRERAALDPLAEEAQRDLMRRLAAAGDRAAAIRAYERLGRRLRDELRLAPAQETRELAETLRGGGEVTTAERPNAQAQAAAAKRRLPLPPLLVLEAQSPLAGRGAELAALRRCWRDAQAGRRGVATLAGEPGIGKTRLAAEFSRAAYEEGGLVLIGSCYEDFPVPYQVVVEALRHYVSESPIDEVRLALGPHRTTLAKLIPELADAGAPAALSATAESPEREQFVFFDAASSLLRAVAAERPLLLVLDDLHWADPSTLLLLRHVVRATEGAPMLILGTYRETEVDEAHPLAQALAELRRARVLTSVALEGLGEEDVTAMISSRSGRSAPAAVARSIVDRTQGNPFFVEELLRGVSVDDDWTDALTRIGVPPSVKDLLLRRMRRLDDTCKRVLTLAAVSGREFALDVLEQVAAMSAETIAETLERAIEDRIVEESTSSIGRYSFTHALIREAIYERVSRARRAQLHRQIGQAIERTAGDRAEEYASTLAYHFSAAGDVPKAYEHHARAAAAAGSVYAVEAALGHYNAALEAAAKLSLDPEHDAALRGFQLQRGRMRYRTCDFTGAEADFETVLGSARLAGDRSIEMETLNELGILRMQDGLTVAAAHHEAALEIARELDDVASQTQALDRLAVISSHLLEFDRALELGERALELAGGTGEETIVGRAKDCIKLAVWQLGDLARLEELTGELEDLWRERGDLWYLQFSLLEAAFVPLGRARWDEAAARLADALAINGRVRDSLAEVLILDALGWLHRSRGAYEEALDAGRRAVALSADSVWGGWAAATLGWTLLDVGAADEAADVLVRGLAAGERMGGRNEIVRCLGPLAWSRWLLGARDEARAHAARAEELLAGVTAPEGAAFLFGAQAYATTARVMLANGASERAEKLVRPVFTAAERSGWCEAAASTALVLGLSLEARGKLDRARATIARSAELSDLHGIPAPGWEAHAALARLAGSRDEADEHAAAAEVIVERMSSGLNDVRVSERLRERTEA